MARRKLAIVNEKIAETIIRVCGWISSLTILLMVVFLFKEGAGLFSSKQVEDGYILAVNKSNKVDHLGVENIKDIFDMEITNWKEVGGEDMDIIVFRFTDITNYVSAEQLGADFENLPQCIDSVLAANAGMIAFFPETYMPENFSGKRIDGDNITLSSFFAGTEWFPTATPAPIFGILPLFLATILVSLAAIIMAVPLALSVAIYMAELASPKVRKILKPTIELLAGIPSVVYGFFGLVVFVPMVQKAFDLPVGETALAGAIILAIMALPTIITVSEDAMRSVPRSMKEASLALGATHWQTIWKVIMPYASSGIIAAIVMGVGRAIGETMAVLMVTGNSAVIPDSLLTPVRTIPATIAAELGEAPVGGAHYQALFMLGCILFVITLLISLAANKIQSKKK